MSPERHFMDKNITTDSKLGLEADAERNSIPHAPLK